MWRAADDALAALAAGYVDAQRLLVRGEEAAWLQFVEDLLAGSGDIGSVVDRADTYGLKLAAWHAVAVAQAEVPVAPAGRLTTWVEQATRSRFPSRGVMVTAHSGRLVCAVTTAGASGVSKDTDGRVLAELTSSAAAELTRGAAWRVAVSRRHDGPLGISRCHAEALDALSVADRGVLAMRHSSTSRRARSVPSRRSLTRPVSHRRSLDDGPSAAGWPVPETSSRGLDVRVRQDLPRPLVSVAGELDLASAGLLSAMLDHVCRSRSRGTPAMSDLHDVEIDIDLSRVTFADTHGMAPVLHRRARIVAASRPVRRVLSLLRAADLQRPSPPGSSHTPLALDDMAG